MTLKVEADTGFGLSGTACMGWRDTQGYRMVGVGLSGKALVSISGKVFAGRHTSKETAKIVLGVMNFTFEYVFPLRCIRARCARCGGSGRRGDGLKAILKCTSCNGKGYTKSEP